MDALTWSGGWGGWADVGAAAVDERVAAIADSIRPFALDIRRGMYDDGKMYMAVVNTVRRRLVSRIITSQLTGGVALLLVLLV
jgi:hypothetical protein